MNSNALSYLVAAAAGLLMAWVGTEVAGPRLGTSEKQWQERLPPSEWTRFLAEPRRELGDVIAGVTYSIETEFVNDTDRPVIITEVETNCGCISPKFYGDTIPPGASETISLHLVPKDRHGPFTQVATLRINDPQLDGMKLTLSGNVVGEIKYSSDRQPIDFSLESGEEFACWLQYSIPEELCRLDLLSLENFRLNPKSDIEVFPAHIEVNKENSTLAIYCAVDASAALGLQRARLQLTLPGIESAWIDVEQHLRLKE